MKQSSASQRWHSHKKRPLPPCSLSQYEPACVTNTPKTPKKHRHHDDSDGKPWYYRANTPKTMINNTFSNPIFCVDSDSVSGGGRIEVAAMVYGSNRRRHKICTAGNIMTYLYLIKLGSLMAMLHYRLLLHIIMIDYYYHLSSLFSKYSYY